MSKTKDKLEILEQENQKLQEELGRLKQSVHNWSMFEFELLEELGKLNAENQTLTEHIHNVYLAGFLLGLAVFIGFFVIY